MSAGNSSLTKGEGTDKIPGRSHDLPGGNIKSDEENFLHYTKYPDVVPIFGGITP